MLPTSNMLKIKIDSHQWYQIVSIDLYQFVSARSISPDAVTMPGAPFINIE